MGTYDAQAKGALALITRKGTGVTLKRRSAASIDPVTQAQTGASVAEHAFKAVALPPGRSAEMRIGSLVGRNILQFHMAQHGQSVVPQPGDLIAFKGLDWTVIWATTYDPAGDGAILSICYVER